MTEYGLLGPMPDMELGLWSLRITGALEAPSGCWSRKAFETFAQTPRPTGPTRLSNHEFD